MPQWSIDVVSDVVCPWCFIGKRHLEAALVRWRGAHPGAAPTVRWHPFELNPDLPPGGADRRAYLEAKFGGPERARAIYARVEAAGQAAGLPFAFDAIRRQPNTRQAHRLLAWAATLAPTQAVPEPQDALAEALFRGYFFDGADYTDDAVLAARAGDAGLDPQAAVAFLASDALRDDIATELDAARQMGVTGVPFFIFDGRLAVSGAQPADVLFDAMQQAWRSAAARSADPHSAPPESHA